MQAQKLVYPSGWASILPVSQCCKRCGVVYRPTSSGGRPSVYCGEECRRAVQQQHKRAARLRRKAATRAVTVETVDPIKVFERDGWRCRLCGSKAPKAKRGTYEADAPELDHIIPLSRGGEHSYRNTQCACRRCNLEKSDRPLGQLLLIG